VRGSKKKEPKLLGFDAMMMANPDGFPFRRFWRAEWQSGPRLAIDFSQPAATLTPRD